MSRKRNDPSRCAVTCLPGYTRSLARICLSLGALAFAGCFGAPDLPTELDVVLPNDVRQVAQAGSGVPLLADSSWDLFRKADEQETENDAMPAESPYGGLLGRGFLERLPPDTRMIRLTFDSAGVATGASENAFYVPDLIGDSLVFDGEFHPTRFPGVAYAAIPFAVTAGNQLGIALPVEVRFLGLQVATAVAYAWGTVDGDRIDGTFGYNVDFNLLADLLLGSGADQYPVYALREP